LAAATLTTLSGLLLTIVGADRAAHSIRGAMCAFGTLASTPGGFLAVGVSLTATVAFGVYAVAHRLDRRLPTLALTRPKFGLLLLIAPLALLDLVATARYLLSLDFSVVASCCSSTLDLGGPSGAAQAARGAPLPFWGSEALLVGAAALSAHAGRRPSAPRAALAAALTLLALAAASAAVVHFVAPHV